MNFDMMNDIISLFLKWIFVISGILYGSIFILFIVPAIKTKQKILWSDWFGLNHYRFSYLDEYKQVCLERGKPLIFYWICRGIVKFFVLSISACFLITFI